LIDVFGVEAMGFCYCRHARRTKISPDDVKLLFRNSPDMTPHLDNVLKKREQEKRDARPLPSSKSKEVKLNPTKTADVEEKRTSRPASPEVQMEKVQEEEENEAMDFENDF
jgi:hypothetical protein